MLSGKTGLIKAYDSKGNQIQVPRDEYRRNILPGIFEKAWKDADNLYSAIVLSLQDEFFADAIAPARHLLDIDGDRLRATAGLGIALMKTGQLDEAQRLFEGYLREEGPSGVIQTNLAKVHSARGDKDKAEESLWDSIVTDPNQDNALDWWGAIQFERGGESARAEALQRIAGLPGSWRAQLWIARDHLERGDLPGAEALYQAALPGAREEGDALMMISGDLGNNGHLREAIDLVLPVYDAKKHGALAGINLVEACLALGERDRAGKILRSLDSLERFDLKQRLDDLHQRARMSLRERLTTRWSRPS